MDGRGVTTTVTPSTSMNCTRHSAVTASGNRRGAGFAAIRPHRFLAAAASNFFRRADLATVGPVSFAPLPATACWQHRAARSGFEVAYFQAAPGGWHMDG